MTVINVTRKIIGALLVLAGLAAACFGVRVCVYAMHAEPYIEDGEDGPTATLDGFLACMNARDWPGAYDYLYNYSSLGLETPPEDEISRMYWDARMDALEIRAKEGGAAQGMRFDRRVTVRCLDFDAIAEEIGRRVQAILTEKVENAYLKSEVYDKDGNYREDIALQALTDATRDVLSDTAPYAYTQECSLSLCFSGGRWLVEVSPAFISALTGGAARG